MAPPPPTHDTGYKLLFSHPEMVRDLLTGYLGGPWIEQADFESLERVNASYVSETERQRHDDMVWRLKVGKQWVWVYLLLEFQSEPDPWMALRMMVYVGLLSQHLIKEGGVPEGQLPTVVPLVLYNGASPWRAATDVAQCYGPSLPGLEGYRPQLRYHLIDEARLKLHAVPQVRNLAEALFRLERSRTPRDIVQVLEMLSELLRGEGMQPLRRTISVWVRMQLRRRAPSANIEEIDRIEDLLEGHAMLEQTIERWFDEATLKGVRQGVQQGIQQGYVKALSLQLRLRFGALPAWAEERLAQASEEELLGWMGALLSATTLEDLMAQPQG
jgi:hypothetical protein